MGNICFEYAPGGGKSWDLSSNRLEWSVGAGKEFGGPRNSNSVSPEQQHKNLETQGKKVCPILTAYRCTRFCLKQ